GRSWCSSFNSRWFEENVAAVAGAAGARAGTAPARSEADPEPGVQRARQAGLEDGVAGRGAVADAERGDVVPVGEVARFGEQLPALALDAQAQAQQTVAADAVAVGEIRMARANQVEGGSGEEAAGMTVHDLAADGVGGCRRQGVVAVDRIVVERERVDGGADQRLDAARAAARPEAAASSPACTVRAMLVDRLVPGADGSSTDRIASRMRAQYSDTSQCQAAAAPSGALAPRRPASTTVPCMASSVEPSPRASSSSSNTVGASYRRPRLANASLPGARRRITPSRGLNEA